MARSLDNPAAGRSGVFRLRLDEGRDPVLRVLADESLAEMLEPATSAHEGGRLHVPTREPLARGQTVRVEVGFGPMADEIILRGVVEQVRDQASRERLVSVRIDWTHGVRVRYILEVLNEGRQASARKSRRVPSSLHATWTNDRGTRTSRLQDISKGGAFVQSPMPPPAGSSLQLALAEPSNKGEPLVVEGLVAWTGRSQGQRGFGVKFCPADRSLAGRIAALVREQERAAGLAD